MNREKKQKKTGVLSSVKRGLIFVGAIILALLIGGIAGALFLLSRKPAQPELTADMIETRIEQVSKLTTAEMTYAGMIRYTDGDIPLLTRKHFNMTYQAKINVGIEAADITYEITDESVIIRLPEAKMLDQVNVLPDSLQFFDEQKALFNPTDHEDTQLALQKAQEDAELHANIEGVKEQANANARELAEALFPQELLGERQLQVVTVK